ncbi:MAG: hypothetical protein QW561_00475 [Candidatus Aenigmatarchaeota archaeon]
MALLEIPNIAKFEEFCKLLKIKHKTERRLIDFHPDNWFPSQRIFNRLWLETEDKGEFLWFLVLKSRQEGISSYSEARLFHATVTHMNTNSVILADTKARSEYIYQMCRTMYDYLPPELRPATRYSTRHEIIFDTKDGKGLKSAIYVATALDQFVGQAMTIFNLHVSEASSFPYLSDVFAIIIPSIPQTKESIVIVESTARGAGQEFHNEWLIAKSGRSIFKPIFIPWFIMPDYTLENHPEYELFRPMSPDGTPSYTKKERELKKIAKKEFDVDLTDGQIAWMRFMIEKTYRGDEDSFLENFPATDSEAFVVAGNTAFSKKILKEMYLQRKPPKRKAEAVYEKGEYNIRSTIVTRDEGRLWIWHEPEAGKIYRIGVDPSGGVGRDYCAMEVIDEIDRKQVAEFQGYIDPIETAYYAIAVAQYYNNAKLAIEINYGLGTQVEARRYYWNFYRHKYLDRITDKPTEKIGWLSTYPFKKELIQYGQHVIQNRVYKIYSERLLSELLTFIQRPGLELASAAPGTHDDLVMSFLIAIYTSYQDRDYLGYGVGSTAGEASVLMSLRSHGVDMSSVDMYTEQKGEDDVMCY